MPLVLEKAVEADIERMIEIMYRALSEDPWDRIMFPTTPEPTNRTNSITRWTKEMHTNPTQSLMKIVDTDLNEIIAFARWSIFKHERSESEWKKEDNRKWDTGTNVEAANAFLSAIIEKRQMIMGGKAHCCKETQAGCQCRMLICLHSIGHVDDSPRTSSQGGRQDAGAMGYCFCRRCRAAVLLGGFPRGAPALSQYGFRGRRNSGYGYVEIWERRDSFPLRYDQTSKSGLELSLRFTVEAKYGSSLLLAVGYRNFISQAGKRGTHDHKESCTSSGLVSRVIQVASSNDYAIGHQHSPFISFGSILIPPT